MPIMKLPIRPVRLCTFKSTPQYALLLRTGNNITTQPAAKFDINLNLQNQTLKKPENLLFDFGGYQKTPSSLIMPAGNHLGHRWMDYQGIKNWEGLLDPLDDTLRDEIIRYGQFVEAAYKSCDFDTSSSSYAKCMYSKRRLLKGAGFSKTGYRVTKNLTATSGIHVSHWTKKALAWMATRTSWVGYVAVCHDKREITRLGRRDVVIALRGTATCLEWLENLKVALTPLTTSQSVNMVSNDSPMVESGFLSLYKSKCGTRPSLQTLIKEEIARILEIYGHEPLSLTITGHSLGAALATLAAFDIKETFENAPLVTVISFGGPRVGNRSFRCHLEKQGTKILRIVNSDDLITKVPGFVIDKNNNNFTTSNHQSDNYRKYFSSWVQKLIEDTQWIYADIGCELRLSSKDSPYPCGINIATSHELNTYLNLVNGFVSSDCPVRGTARKMMKQTLG